MREQRQVKGLIPTDGQSLIVITPARNEERNIGRLLSCMTSQTVLPKRWIIVDDNSTDGTGELVRKHLIRHDWIEIVVQTGVLDRNFAAKVDCFNAGYRRARSLGFDIIGNIDADVSFGPDYLGFLLGKFGEDPDLGVAGTPFVEDDGYSSVHDSYEGERHVAGGCQFFRRECFEAIGGYVANRKGGIDWIAVTTARMKGWTTRSFRERSFHHHRSLGTGESSAIAAQFNYGRKDYYLGNHPVWELFRIFYQMGRKPYVLGGLTLTFGYLSEAIIRERRPISRELLAFHRNEELQKLRAIVGERLRRMMSRARGALPRRPGGKRNA